VAPRAVPVQAGERIEVVDILRGFAILGILVGNMASYSGLARDPLGYSEAIDRAILVLTRFFVEAKFYSLFSFLFGWGMAVQMARAETRGVRFVPLYARRLLVLLGIGLVHAVFVWSGDILTTYALLGFILLLSRKLPAKFLLIAAGVALSFSIVVTLPGELLEAIRAWYERLTGFLRSGNLPPSTYATGTYGEITRLRIQEYLGANSWFIYWAGNILGMFLLGLYVGKRRLLHNVDRHPALLRIVLVSGLAIGLIFNGAYVLILVRPELVPADLYWMVSRALRTIGAPALMLFYAAVIVLLVQTAAWRNRLLPLAHLGRGALSNYLLQSVVCTLLFYSYGLGLYGQIDPLLGLILTVVILLVQIRLSSWWFSLHQFGPAEWVWRSLVYQGIRLEPGGETADGVAKLRPGGLRGSSWRTTGQVDSRLVLAGALLVLLSCFALFVMRNASLQGSLQGVIGTSVDSSPLSGATPTEPEISSTRAAVEVTDSQKATDGPGQLALTPVATPVLHPVRYEPGPIAASGHFGEY
jgi:uncharacterized protein